MGRESALKIVLVLVGVIFTAAVYLLMMFFSREPSLAMMLSLYFTLGIFLLMAARNPSAHRSLIAFTAWSSFAHAVMMGLQVYEKIVGRDELMGVGLLFVIGIVLVALAPVKGKARSSPASQNPHSSEA